MSDVAYMRVFYFDSNAIVKYYASERGSEVVRRLVDGTIDGIPTVRITSQTSFYEVPKVFKKKLNLPENHPQKIDKKAYRRRLSIFRKGAEIKFRPMDFRKQGRKKPFNYRKIMEKHNVEERDARHVVCVLNYLSNIRPPSGPIIISSDKKHVLRVFKNEGYEVFDPEKQTIADLEKMIDGRFD